MTELIDTAKLKIVVTLTRESTNTSWFPVDRDELYVLEIIRTEFIDTIMAVTEHSEDDLQVMITIYALDEDSYNKYHDYVLTMIPEFFDVREAWCKSNNIKLTTEKIFL